MPKAEPTTEFPLTVKRTRTVTGWEWFLTIGGVRLSKQGVGVFTELGAKPQDVLPRLLARHMTSREGS